MSNQALENRSWKEIVNSWTHPRVITMFFLGISAGTPILLIFGTLSIWLTEAGVTKSSVTFFSWAALGYSFKFVWAPLIDKIPFPYLSKALGRRRSWMLLAQLSIISAILWMASIDPSTGKESLTFMALAAVMLGFSSATQDIVIDAYRIECIDESYQALLAATYIAGYRIGMVVAGAGALFLASYLGTTEVNYLYPAWRLTYSAVACFMLIGVLTTLLISEPQSNKLPGVYSYSKEQYIKLFCIFIVSCLCFCLVFFYSGQAVMQLKKYFAEMMGNEQAIINLSIECTRLLFAFAIAALMTTIMVKAGLIEEEVVVETYIDPIADFFRRYGLKTAFLLLFLIGFYRVSDIVLGVIANVFYVDLGFSKNTIAAIAKTYGLGMTIIGGFLGGMLTLRYGVYAILFLGALLSSATNLLFMGLAGQGADIGMLTVVIAIDNLSAGIAGAAFVAFLSSLTSVSFTAVQYALFTSLMTLFPKLIGGYSGTIVEALDYSTFFLLTACMGIPVLLFIWLVQRMEGAARPSRSGN